MILITGHKGYIGTRLFDKLKDVIGIDLKDGKNLLTCDLPKNIDIIYHLAAQSSVESSWQDTLHDLDNIRITARLVKEYPNTKIIYANSCASISKESPYGFSKGVSGEYLLKFHSNVVNCIFPNIYGYNSKSVVDIFKNQDEVTIFGDGNQTRDYVHLDDIVEGLILAKDWDSGTYFMGSGKSMTVNELARGKKIIYAPARKEAYEVSVPNTTPNWLPKIKL
jgi:UDP-glucose 4-epimerase